MTADSGMQTWIKCWLLSLQDGFGNYCLQYVLELGQQEVNGSIMEKLVGHFPELSQQKFSSNVVEKCLKLTGAELGDRREQIVREIIDTPLLPRLLQVLSSLSILT